MLTSSKVRMRKQAISDVQFRMKEQQDCCVAREIPLLDCEAGGILCSRSVQPPK